MNDDDRITTRAIFKLISLFRDLDQEMPMNQAMCLLWVALNEGRTQVELRQDLDMPSSTSSRNLAALSKVHRLGKNGLDLIEWVENPEDRRAKLLFLSRKGKVFMDRVRKEVI